MNSSFTTDAAFQRAQETVLHALDGGCKPLVKAFFDEATSTISYVVHDPGTMRAAVIDPVLDFEIGTSAPGVKSADALIGYISLNNLKVDWILETHVHADHLTAAFHLKAVLGGSTATGRGIHDVYRLIHKGCAQSRVEGDVAFDRLLSDGDVIEIGGISCVALHVPGHTPSDTAFVIGDAVFCGDTMLMPDFGTARADFPGGDANVLFRSIRRLQALPDAARVFTCHDYKAPGRSDYAWEASMLEQRNSNIHASASVDEAHFVSLRTARDATLARPRMMVPAIQFNVRGGRSPDPDGTDWHYTIADCGD